MHVRLSILIALFFVVTKVGFSNGQSLCVDVMLQEMNLHNRILVEQGVIDELLEDDFYLSNFTKAKELIKSHVSSESLEQLRDRIKNAIVTRHPAINEVICQVNNKGIMSSLGAGSQRVINRTLHSILILEALVQEMKKSPTFMAEVKDHYLKERYKILPEDSSLWDTYKAAGGFFETAKLLTMDEVFDQYVYFLKKKDLTKKDLDDKSFGLRLNIAEASLADEVKGNFANASAGRTLIVNPIEAINVEDGVVKQYFPDGWAELYETWNLAFVIGNLPNLDMILPKLLIPSVIDASPEDYLFYRGVSLWLTVNNVLLHNLNGKESINLDPKLKKDLVKIWGQVNSKYARAFTHKPWPIVFPYWLGLGSEAAFRFLFNPTGK